MKFKALVLSLALVLGANLFAQESNRDANGNIQYGPYETNKFFDNWFTGLGGGLDAVSPSMDADFVRTPVFEFFVGKWFDPCFGARIGVDGMKANYKNVDLPSGYLHGDLLWNVTNQFFGYSSNRFYNLAPYASAGFLFGDKTRNTMGIGAGLLNTFKIANQVDIFADFRGVICPTGYFDKKEKSPLCTAAVGILYNIDRADWTRLSTSLAASAAALAQAEAAMIAAQAASQKAEAAADAAARKVESLAAENKCLKEAFAQEEARRKALEVDLAKTPIIAYFELGKAVLTPAELEHLDFKIKAALADKRDIDLTIAGNADTKTGSANFNKKLTQKRADYIAKLLEEKYGFDSDKFTIKANGGNDVFAIPALNRCTFISR